MDYIKALKAVLFTRILLPWAGGGGTLGLSFRNDHLRWYGDLFWSGSGGGRTLRCFVNDGIFRRWSTLTWNGWEVDKVEVLDAENAARIFRRTMEPCAILTLRRNGMQCEALNYPCPNPDNTVSITVKNIGDDSGMLDERDCDEFEFSRWYGRTGIPACDPIKRGGS